MVGEPNRSSVLDDRYLLCAPFRIQDLSRIVTLLSGPGFFLAIWHLRADFLQAQDDVEQAAVFEAEGPRCGWRSLVGVLILDPAPADHGRGC